ncbi:MAG: radical SAM protein [Thermoplasmata archaeon]
MRARCELCGREKRGISSFLGLCPECARKPEAREIAREAHRRSLENFGLTSPGTTGRPCGQCANNCHIENGKRGTCGLRTNDGGLVRPMFGEKAIVDWYYDPLPTNCVAEWACPANDAPARGKKNLAVFFYGCTFDCLFCQNWHHKEGPRNLGPQRTAEQLVRAVDNSTFCVCFFGGDPTPQLEYAFRACDLLLSRDGESPRVCWETNGSMASHLAEEMLEISLRTGGTVKFDLKAFDENLHYVLCGVSNKRTLDNFRKLGERVAQDKSVMLVASTLLVPGYVSADEVFKIASFIAEVDPEIPYSLLAFHPDYVMTDLGITTSSQAREALAASTRAGLKRVRIGNVHLLV